MFISLFQGQFQILVRIVTYVEDTGKKRILKLWVEGKTIIWFKIFNFIFNQDTGNLEILEASAFVTHCIDKKEEHFQI